MNPLIGKTIKEIFITNDKIALKFVLEDDNEIVATCDADCCSETWIEDIINPEAVIGSPILSVIDVDLPAIMQQPTRTDRYEDSMQYYGCRIDTAKGSFVIAYRN